MWGSRSVAPLSVTTRLSSQRLLQAVERHERELKCYVEFVAQSRGALRIPYPAITISSCFACKA